MQLERCCYSLFFAFMLIILTQFHTSPLRVSMHTVIFQMQLMGTGVRLFPGLAADPCLNAEPAARHDGPHERRQVRTCRAVGGARKNRKRNPVLRPGVRVEQDRDEDDRVAEQDREHGLHPAHTRGHEARGQHVGRNAMRHADPQRRVVVRRPTALVNRDRRQVRVVERTRLEARPVGKFDPAVGMLDFSRLSALDCHRSNPRRRE